MRAEGTAGCAWRGGGIVSFAYDGRLPTEESWTGEVDGTVSVKYDDNFRVTALSVNAGAAVPFGYDEDGLLTQAGDLAVARSPVSGLITGTTLDGITTSHAYNVFGEPAEFRTQAGTGDLFHATYTRDNVGRITGLSETAGGVTTTRAYAYDLAGRLSEVRTDGVLTATYEYGQNGNRISFTGPSGTVTVPGTMTRTQGGGR